MGFHVFLKAFAAAFPANAAEFHAAKGCFGGSKARIVEAGRVEKFRAKFAAKKQALNTAAEAAKSTK